MKQRADTGKNVAVKSVLKKKSLQQHDKNKTNETGGPKGPEPTRYGDWERKGRCVDF